MTVKRQKPKVYDYTDHLKFMNNMVDFFKKESKVFSFRFFAKKAGFASQSTLKFFLTGKRGLSPDSIAKVCKGFGLDAHESEYFENLIKFHQTASNELKNKYFDEMRNMHKRKNIHVLSSDHYEYFSKWYHPAIYELVRCPDFEADGKWIARRIFPMISVIEARESLRLLLRLGLIQKGEDGKFVQTDRVLATEPELLSMIARNFHREMSNRAAESLDQVALDRRDFRGVTFALPPSRVKQLKTMINEFTERLASTLSTFGEPTEEVYHLNLQLFPLTKKEKK